MLLGSPQFRPFTLRTFLVLKIVKMALNTAHKVACLKMISITSAGIYTGAALYVNFVEFPGLLEMDDAARGHQAFMHVFKRASKFMVGILMFMSKE